MSIRIANYTLASACGLGLEQLNQALSCEQTPLRKNNYEDSNLDTWIGCVEGVEHHRLPASLKALDSRNNRLADLALSLDRFDQSIDRAVKRLGSHRVGVIIGTSTSSVGRTESGYTQLDSSDRMPDSYQQSDVHNPHAPGFFVARRLGITGPSMTISTACSSSTKVFAAGSRWLRSGLVDAVVVGGVDSMCMSILHGFASLELVSVNPCKPFDTDRDGINIGEAAGFALLLPEQKSDEGEHTDINLTGIGESSDAFHMAQPHPEGAGAIAAMAAALKSSQCAPDDIGYISLHGTATPANDLTEAKAVASLFSDVTLASSTKGWTGHTLGAAGITGAVITLESMRTGNIPGTLNLENPDEALGFPILKNNRSLAPEQSLDHAMVNSFGFGGNNCSLVFSRATA